MAHHGPTMLALRRRSVTAVPVGSHVFQAQRFTNVEGSRQADLGSEHIRADPPHLADQFLATLTNLDCQHVCIEHGGNAIYGRRDRLDHLHRPSAVDAPVRPHPDMVVESQSLMLAWPKCCIELWLRTCWHRASTRHHADA